MFYNKALHCGFPGKQRAAFAGVVMMAALVAGSCGGAWNKNGFPVPEYDDGAADLYSMALRFAPVLYLHPDEPHEIVAIIPVFHPSRPLVAYHIFFDDDAFFAGRGKSNDHEIMWVQYDPVTLKVTDIFTLWHRTVLRTDACLMDAKDSGQRPRIDVQWGQHGMLPYGWRGLAAARPQLELRAHYKIARYLNRLPGASTGRPAVMFEGSYDEYLRFTKLTDASDYIEERNVMVARYSARELRSRLGEAFAVKKEWPDW